MTEEYERTEQEGFHITSDQLADWAIKIIKAAREERERLKAIAEDDLLTAVRLHDEQIAALDRSYENDTQWLTGELANYYRSVSDDLKHETKTMRKYKLLTGDIIEKFPSVKYERDDAVLLNWTKNTHPDLVKVKESVNWEDLKKTIQLSNGMVVDADGVVIDGVTMAMTETEIEVQIK